MRLASALRVAKTLRASPSAPLERYRGPDRSGSVLGVSKSGGFHRLSYVEWGDPKSERVAICVHGLSRQGRDFDLIAAELARCGWRVVCPDLVGRGRSDWLFEPRDYILPQYVADLTTLIARLGVPEVDWIGTSLGGILGILMAGQKQSPVRSLVVNDIAPFVPWQVLQRLSEAVRTAPLAFPTLEAAIDYFRTALVGFGELPDSAWAHLARHSVTETAGGWQKLSDGGISMPFRTNILFNLSIWNYWDAISCPTLVLRGELSDVLPRAVAEEMSQRGPRARIAEFAKCGHAPALMEAEQIGTVVGWLEDNAVGAARRGHGD